MVIKDYNGKVFIELTVDKLILHRRFSKKEFNLKDIKAAYLTDEYILKFIYLEKIKFYNINNISIKDKYIIEELFIHLNIGKNVFYTPLSYGRSEMLFAATLIFASTINIIINSVKKSWVSIIWIISLISSLIAFFTCKNEIMGFFYYVKEEEIEYGIGPKKKNNKFSIMDEFTFDYNSIYKEYLLKKGEKKFKFTDNILYPQYYKEELRKLSEKKMVRVNDDE